jgi:hypothetical protein
MPFLISIDIGVKNFCFCIEEYNLNNVNKGNIILIEKIDLTTGGNTNHSIFQTLINVFDKYKCIFSTCNVVLIERQMKINIIALKVFQHCYTYFMIQHPELTIIDFPSSCKTSVFGIKHKTKPERKKWAIDKASVLLIERGEYNVYHYMIDNDKRDDIADVILQSQAYKIKNAIE